MENYINVPVEMNLVIRSLNCTFHVFRPVWNRSNTKYILKKERLEKPVAAGVMTFQTYEDYLILKDQTLNIRVEAEPWGKLELRELRFLECPGEIISLSNISFIATPVGKKEANSTVVLGAQSPYEY